MSHRRVRKEKKATNYCIYGSVTRYGPQSVAQRKWLSASEYFMYIPVYVSSASSILQELGTLSDFM